MPPLKSSAAFHEQRRGLEQAEIEHCHKRKIRCESGSPEASKMQILDEKSAKPQLQAKQLQQKKNRLANDLNNKIAHRPGPIELIHKNILPVDSCFKQVIIERRFPKASGGNSSCDEDSNDSLSPRQSESREHPVGIEPVCSSAEKLAGSNLPSLIKVPPSALPFQHRSITLNSSVQKTCGNSKIRCQRPTQKHKKTKDNKPKIKKLKYHQYIPPDKKGDNDPPLHLDSSYAKILQQQQLFLQLQILSQQQHNNHTPLPASPDRDHDPTSSSSSSNLTSTSSPLEPSSAPSTVLPVQSIRICPSTAPLNATNVSSLHLNLDEMKVAELKCELKLRRLPVSGTRKDLIERLRTHQELSQSRDTIYSPTAGGTAEPEHERAGTSSKTGGSFSENKPSTQQLLRCDGAIKSFPRPSMLNGTHPEEIRVNSDSLRELMSSPVSDVSLQPFTTAPLTATVKQEPRCSSPAPCHFSLKSASLQKHSLVSFAAPATTAATPPVAVDKDKMLQEKDKQIAELTRMLLHNQSLVDELKMQLENRNRDASETQILGRVKKEPPDTSHEAFLTSPSLFDPHISVISHDKEVTNVAIKEEAIETEIGSEMSSQSPDTLLQPSTPPQLTPDQIHLQLQPEQRSLQKQVCLQDSARQLAQQQAISRLVSMQQQNTKKQQRRVQSLNQALEPHQKPRSHRQKRSEKLHQQRQLLQSEQHHPQLEQKRQQQQVLLGKQEIVVEQQFKKPQQQTKKLQPLQIQTRIHLQKQDLLKNESSRALVCDSKSKHILIPLTNHNTGYQGSYSVGKASNNILLKDPPPENPSPLSTIITLEPISRDNEETMEELIKRLHGCRSVPLSNRDKEEVQTISLSEWEKIIKKGPCHRPLVPPSLHSSPTWKKSPSPFYQAEMFPGLDVLLSPLSPDSVQTATAPSHDKLRDNEDFIDIILQAGETPNTQKVAQDFSFSSPSPSPLQLLLSPPNSPTAGTLQPGSPPQPEPWTPAKTTDYKQHFDLCGSGNLESTNGKPLLGLEPGGLHTLFGDLHNQMICPNSILHIPPTLMDSLDIDEDREQRLDSKEWLDFAMGADNEWEIPTLVPQIPPSVFSADFLDSSDLHMDWDSRI